MSETTSNEDDRRHRLRLAINSYVKFAQEEGLSDELLQAVLRAEATTKETRSAASMEKQGARANALELSARFAEIGEEPIISTTRAEMFLDFLDREQG